MREKGLRKGKVIFYQGDSADCMYYIFWGTVGVYTDYGTKNQRLLAELSTGDYFGEMGLLDHEARTATIVVLENDTVLDRITEEDFSGFLKENPARVMNILSRLGHKLRNTTSAYLQLCQAVDASVGSKTDEVNAATNYGFADNEHLKAIHDGINKA